MTRFEDSYVGRLRAEVGTRLLKLPGACVVLEDAEGRILLEQSVGRADWRLVGGLAEERESLVDCARREVLEETGLRLGALETFGFCDDPRYIAPLSNGDIVYSHTLLFWTHEFDGELRPQAGEIERLGWFDPRDLPASTNKLNVAYVHAYIQFQETGRFQLITSDAQGSSDEHRRF